PSLGQACPGILTEGAEETNHLLADRRTWLERLGLGAVIEVGRDESKLSEAVTREPCFGHHRHSAVPWMRMLPKSRLHRNSVEGKVFGYPVTSEVLGLLEGEVA